MKIIGIDGMTNEQVRQELQRGGRFVIYHYCISLVIMTFKRSSNVYLIKGGDNSVVKGLGLSALTLLLGWWGIPWGPIYTIQSLVTNFRGGKDVTAAIVKNAGTTSAAAAIPQARR